MKKFILKPASILSNGLHYLGKAKEVLEKNFGNAFNGNQQQKNTGKVIDTIYVVIDKNK